MRLIDADALEEHKFVGIKFVQIGGRTNGKTLESINKAYQQGWNDCIDAIIDNAPTVKINDKSLEIAKKSIELGREVGKLEGKLERPQGEWIRHDEWRNGEYIGGFYHVNCPCEDGYYSKWTTNFCPNCGAEMRGGES